MRFLGLSAALALLGFASTPLARPKGSGCCCCDISRPAIACTYSIAASECFCTDVVCPADAPVVWDDAPTGTPLYLPALSDDPPTNNPPEGDLPKDEAEPKAAVEPANPLPRAADGQLPKADVEGEGPGSEDRLQRCCCCDIRIQQTVCRLKAPEDCWCAAVVCPLGSPTIYLETMPMATGAAE